MKVKDVLSAFLRHASAEGVFSEQTRRNREPVFADFAATYGGLDHTELKGRLLKDWVASHPSWKSPATQNSMAAWIAAAFEWAATPDEQGEKLIAHNPLRGVKATTRKPPKRKPTSDATLDRVRRAANKPLDRLLRFQRLTMCRITEACRATWDHMHLDAPVPYWVIPDHKTLKETGEAKVKPLLPEAVALLRELLQEASTAGGSHSDKGTVGAGPVAGAGAVGAQGVKPVPAGGGHVFLNNRGNPWERHAAYKALRRVGRKLGVQEPLTLHGIRRNAITMALANGASIDLIAEMAGHGDPRTTKGYANLDEHLDKVAQAARLGLPESQKHRPPPCVGA